MKEIIFITKRAQCKIRCCTEVLLDIKALVKKDDVESIIIITRAYTYIYIYIYIYIY